MSSKVLISETRSDPKRRGEMKKYNEGWTLLAKTLMRGERRMYRELWKDVDGKFWDIYPDAASVMTNGRGDSIERHQDRTELEEDSALDLYRGMRTKVVSIWKAFGSLEEWSEKELVDEIHRRGIVQEDLLEKTLSQCSEEEILVELMRRVEFDGWDPKRISHEKELAVLRDLLRGTTDPRSRDPREDDSSEGSLDADSETFEKVKSWTSEPRDVEDFGDSPIEDEFVDF